MKFRDIFKINPYFLIGALLFLILTAFFNITGNTVVYAQDDGYGQGGYDSYGQGGYDSYGQGGYDYGQGGYDAGPGDAGPDAGPGDPGGDGLGEPPSDTEAAVSPGVSFPDGTDATTTMTPGGNIETTQTGGSTVGLTPDGVSYTNDPGAIAGATPVDSAPDGVPSGNAFWSGENGGWAVADPGNGSAPDPGSGDMVTAPDPGGGGGDTGNGGGDNPTNGDTPPPAYSPPPNVGPTPCTSNCSPTPPADFSQHRPITYECSVTGGDPTIRTYWDSSANFSNYYVYYIDSANPSNLNGPLGTSRREYYDFNQASGLTPGHQYSFIIVAANNSGFQTSSDGGLWSHELFGYTVYPDCSAPGPFDLTSVPQASCPAISDPRITVSWNPSAGATNYAVMYRDTADNLEKTYSNLTTERSETVRGLISGHSYNFTVAASKTNTNPYNSYLTFSNNAWSAPVFFPDCSPPTFTTFNITSGGRSTSPGNAPLTIKQTEAFNMGWNVTNTSSCTAGITPASGSETLTPSISGAWLVNPKPVSGTHSFGVNQITSQGTYDFTLTCTNPVNSAISASASVGLTVQPLRNPYIEFQGDFHTNESVDLNQN